MCADIDRSCNKIEITEQGSPYAVFRVMPRYKFRQEGESVLYRDQIVLLNIKTNLYLHITENLLEKVKPAIPLQEDWRPLDADRRDDPAEFAKRFEVNCSTSSSRFQLIPMTQINEDPTNKFIKGNQVIRLQHTELGGYLTSDDLDFTEDELAEIYVKCFNGDSKDIEAVSSGDLFEIEIASNYDRGKVCVWTNISGMKGAVQYRLRHLNSGRLVKTQTVKLGNEFISLGLADHIDDRNAENILETSLLNFISTTVDSDNRIRAGTSLKIQDAYGRKFLSTKADKEWTGGVQGGGERSNFKEGMRKMSGTSISDIIGEAEQLNASNIQGTRNKGKSTGIYNPLDDEELYNCRNCIVELQSNASNEDTFMIIPVDETEVKDLLFIQTVASQLNRYTKYLRAREMEKITKAKYTKIIDLLTRLIFFIIETEGEDPVTCTGYPIKNRQKLMRELRVLELLVDCLYYPFKYGGYTIQSLTDDMPLKRISIL